MSRTNLDSKEEKYLYDVVYISHKDLGIPLDTNSNKEDRPCIIISKNDKDKIYGVLIMTTKRSNNIKQIKTESGYINLDKVRKVKENIINYAGLAKEQLDQRTMEKIEERFGK